MLHFFGFLLLAVACYFALGQFTLPLWVKLVSSILTAVGLISGIAGVRQRIAAARNANQFLEGEPTKESLGDWLKKYGVDADGKNDSGVVSLVGASLSFAMLPVLFYVNPWIPGPPLEYVGLIIMNIALAIAFAVVPYKVIEALLTLFTGRTIGAMVASEQPAAQELTRNWDTWWATRKEKQRSDLDLGLWVIVTVLLSYALSRFIPWSPGFYEAHRFVAAFISIVVAGAIGLGIASALHYARMKEGFRKKEILGFALACLIAPAITGTLGGVNHLGTEGMDVYGFPKIASEGSSGFQTRSQRRERMVESLFNYITSRHGLASIGSAAVAALPFAIGSLALLSGGMRSHLWKEEYKNYNLVGVILGLIGLIIWISS